MSTPVRVRFAPSPTGFMHLGNVRAALLNYLFAQQYAGTFILRIEDTDAQRNLDAAGQKIFDDLAWLGLKYTEGPLINGPYEPYYQSQRSHLYQEGLSTIIANKKAYRCFCTVEELENKRQRQIALKKPPRYDRTCLQLSTEAIDKKVAEKTAFIWRFNLDDTMAVTIDELSRGRMTFELKNFSDFALTREDGSCTFLFANFIDDCHMKISHVIRGEDHLSNTALQAALYHAFGQPLPKFWHLPTICSKDGKKLSKRDFGFSLDDLKHAGFLPQAVNNYLAILGSSFAEEIQSTDELSKSYQFSHLHATSGIHYDLDKLTWINHKWINRLTIDELMPHLMPFLQQDLPECTSIEQTTLKKLVKKIKPELRLLKDAASTLQFYFTMPIVTLTELHEKLGTHKANSIISIIHRTMSFVQTTDAFLDALKKEAKAESISIKEIFSATRYLLTGRFDGIGMHDLFEMLGNKEVEKRLMKSAS